MLILSSFNTYLLYVEFSCAHPISLLTHYLNQLLCTPLVQNRNTNYLHLVGFSCANSWFFANKLLALLSFAHNCCKTYIFTQLFLCKHLVHCKNTTYLHYVDFPVHTLYSLQKNIFFHTQVFFLCKPQCKNTTCILLVGFSCAHPWFIAKQYLFTMCGFPVHILESSKITISYTM